MSAPTVPQGRPPLQARARATQERLLEAAAELLAGHGAAGFTMSDVAERAGVSIGSLYRWFPAPSSLVRELALRHLDAARVDALAAIAGGGRPIPRLERALRAYLASADEPLVVEIIRSIEQDPALRALDREDSVTNARLLTEAVGLPADRVPAVALVIDLAGHLIPDLAERPRRERASIVETFVAMARAAVGPAPSTRS